MVLSCGFALVKHENRLRNNALEIIAYRMAAQTAVYRFAGASKCPNVQKDKLRKKSRLCVLWSLSNKFPKQLLKLQKHNRESGNATAP
jgi:hypothetical protein